MVYVNRETNSVEKMKGKVVKIYDGINPSCKSEELSKKGRERKRQKRGESKGG